MAFCFSKQENKLNSAQRDHKIPFQSLLLNWLDLAGNYYGDCIFPLSVPIRFCPKPDYLALTEGFGVVVAIALSGVDCPVQSSE